MISAKYLHQVQAFLLSGLMSFIMSGAISFINLGIAEHFMDIWINAWLVAWAVAFPSILVVFPFARKVALKIASK